MPDTLDLVVTRFWLDQPVPDDPGEVATAAARWLGGPVDHPTVIVLRGTEGVRYQVQGELPCPLDAVARVLVDHAGAGAVIVAAPGSDHWFSETAAGQVVVSWRARTATFRARHRRWIGVHEGGVALWPLGHAGEV
jgi:hypothetical protein